MKAAALAFLLSAVFLYGCVSQPFETPPKATPTPAPTATPALTPSPIATPAPTPGDALRELKCRESGGTWMGGEGMFACECGGNDVYNMTTLDCQPCPEGQLIGRGLGPAFCYTPSGHNGQPCDRSTDCGGGSCVLVNASASVGKGECHDLPFGCFVRIDENGSFDPTAVLCVD